jgi:uncharacterized protein
MNTTDTNTTLATPSIPAPKPAALTVAHALAVQNLSGDVPSPCVSVCRMDELREFCVGCSRTLEELRQWRTMGNGEKQAVWALIAQRIAAAPPLPVTPQPATPEPVTQ